MFDTPFKVLISHSLSYVIMQKDPKGEITAIAVYSTHAEAFGEQRELEGMFPDHRFWVHEVVRRFI